MIRKGEIDRRQIERHWPYQVALPAEALRGSANCTAMYRLTRELAGALPPYSLMCNDIDCRIFRFPTAEAAQAFHARFGGELLPDVETEPERLRRRR